MHVLIAPDKFRGSLTASEAALALKCGVVQAWPGCYIDLAPVADGGEGTVETMIQALGGTTRRAQVSGPMGVEIEAAYGLAPDGKLAVIEMAAASGLSLVPAGQRDPSRATTRGTGELLLEAIAQGATTIVMGIGGSATNDGGAGLAQALGYRLLDREGKELGPGGGELERLDRIDASRRDRRLDGVSLQVACDVANPLCGPNGAAAVYGPQKGATPEMVERLDRNLKRLAAVLRRDLGVDVADQPGAGAAGGLGAGLVAFAGGHLRPGIELVMSAIQLEKRMQGAGLCLTGEGCLDRSSAAGKTVVGVARLARSKGVPVLALAGAIGEGAEAVLEQGVTAYFGIALRPMDMDQAVANARENLTRTTEQVVRAFRAGVER